MGLHNLDDARQRVTHVVKPVTCPFCKGMSPLGQAPSMWMIYHDCPPQNRTRAGLWATPILTALLWAVALASAVALYRS